MDRDDRRNATATGPAPGAVEEVEVRGHIVDSLLLPKILDRILQMGGTFEIRECTDRRRGGSTRATPGSPSGPTRPPSSTRSSATSSSTAPRRSTPRTPGSSPADIAGAFPEDFYSTTNQRTQVRLGGRWVDVADQEMDCGIAVDPAGRTARCVPMTDVDARACRSSSATPGSASSRSSGRARRRLFGFMGSNVSSEKPKAVSLQAVAESIRETRAEGKKVLLVGGPAIVHTGSAEHVARLIREGWVQTLFAGNALATHDIEQALYGTSLGVSIDARRGDRARPRAPPPRDQHDPPARRDQAGGRGGRIDVGDHVRVRQGRASTWSSPARSATTARLPEVITDTLAAQTRMRQAIHGRRLRPDDRHGPALDRHGEPAAGLGQGRLRRHQPGHRDQAERPGHVPDDRPGHRRRAVPAQPGGRAGADADDRRRRLRDVARRDRDAHEEAHVMDQPANPDVPARLLRDRVRDQPVDEPRRSASDPAESRRQWRALHDTLRRPGRARSSGSSRSPGLPDLVFTANAGLVYHDLFISSRFRYGVRQGETPHFDALGARRTGSRS